MRTLITASLLCLTTAATFAAPAPFPAFRAQEIDKSLKIGYAVRLADINRDGKPDIVVCDANRVIWFDNASGWKLHTITEGKVKADNVCIALHDIDGDGKLDLALGADWQFTNTKSGGSLQWLRQGDDVDQAWEIHPILKELPTLHRINFADVTGDGKPELIAGPLKGRNSTQDKNFMDAPTQLLAFSIPKDPAGPWEPIVLTDTLHVMHNFQPIDFDHTGKTGVLTASYEGVSYVSPAGDGKWATRHVGAGYQEDPKASRGSSEVKLGRLKSGKRFIATAEPFHGNYVVAYTEDAGSAAGATSGLWKRTVVDEQIKWGHAVWCADLDGDGGDEFVLGFRDPLGTGRGPGVNVYRATASQSGDAVAWEKHVIEDTGVATEDMTCGDLNGDGRVDIVAVGRATHNVRIYWNQGMPGSQASPPTQAGSGSGQRQGPALTPPGPPNRRG
jgi:hypothetical protein